MNRNMSDSPEVFGCGRCGVEFLGHSVPITARCVYRHFKKHHREKDVGRELSARQAEWQGFASGVVFSVIAGLLCLLIRFWMR